MTEITEQRYVDFLDQILAALGQARHIAQKAARLSDGRAYEAAVVVALSRRTGWKTHHPDEVKTVKWLEGVWVFAGGNGSWPVSYLTDLDGRHYLPSRNVIGRSGETHEIDIAVVEMASAPDKHAVDHTVVKKVIECKNYPTHKLPFGQARALIGAAIDLHPTKVALISSGELTQGTKDYLTGITKAAPSLSAQSYEKQLPITQ